MEKKACLLRPTKDLKTNQIKGCINELMFSPTEKQTDKELLTITILKDKADKFKFLKGSTTWKTIGTWQEVDKKGRVTKKYPDEKNVTIEVEYKDQPDEAVGERLMDLFSEYNKREVKERLLYVRSQDVDESSL